MLNKAPNLYPDYYFSMTNMFGSLKNSDLGELELSGLSAGGGSNLILGDNWSMALEAIASFGSTNWKQPPFTNSSGKEFDPSMMALLAKVSYIWGRYSGKISSYKERVIQLQ